MQNGKLVVRDVSVPVERILTQLAGMPDSADVLALYPELTLEDLRAVFAYAAAAVQSVTAAGQAATVVRDVDIWANYDPDRALQALDRLREALRGFDVKRWKAAVREARGHPPVEEADEASP